MRILSAMVGGVWLTLLGALLMVSATQRVGLASQTRQLPSREQQLEFFEKKVRPLLAAHCYECHSSEADTLEGSLRLDSRAGMLKGGDSGPAVVPGKPEESLLIDAVNYGEVYQMPPKSKLPQRERDILNQWVAWGAAWPDGGSADSSDHRVPFDVQTRKQEHWAWKPVQSVGLPPVNEKAWPIRELDFFVLARLEEAGIQPASPAEARELIRRVYLDLIGLPPSLEQIEKYVRDPSPQAYAEVVDDLLDSPQFGEKWARHWMDLVRYAETYGHEFDYPIRHAWRYRDYLIRAFNADVPYDQVVREHVAGDLLADPRRHPIEGYNESVMGTNFWFLGEATHAPVDVRGDEAGRIDNQIDVFAKTFLGLTVACARCHDHKFDAIGTDDYYALAGVLQSSRRNEAFLDRDGKISAARQYIEQLHTQMAHDLAGCEPQPWPDDLVSYLRAAARVKFAAAEPAQAAAEAGLDAARLASFLAAWEDARLDDAGHPLHAIRLLLSQSMADAETTWVTQYRQWLRDVGQAAARADGAADNNEPSGDNRATAYPLVAADLSAWRPAGMAFGAGPLERPVANIAGAGKDWRIPANVWHSGVLSRKLQGAVRSPTFTIEHPNLFYHVRGENCDVRLIIDGYTMFEFNGLLFKGVKFPIKSPDRFVWHRQAQDLRKYVGHRAYIEVLDQGDGWVAIDQVRSSESAQPPPPVLNDWAIQLAPAAADLDAWLNAFSQGCRQIVARAATDQADRDEIAIANWFWQHQLIPLTSQRGVMRRASENLAATPIPGPLRIFAMTDGSPEDERIHIRGNHKNLGQAVPRGMLTAMVGDRPKSLSDSGRQLLAEQLVSLDNPLTRRVVVNRLWHHLFGRGLVASVDNFGVLGEAPTHPRLLDHLAVDLVQEGWSLKSMIRKMVTSQTYRMSSRARAASREVDPSNHLLHAMRIRRMTSETLRDTILSVSGRLDLKMYGPSVPVHVTVFMQGRGRPRNSGPLDGNGRRSVYQEVRRNFLNPMMLAFDTPIPFNAIGRRNVSNVPAQALILMNDPFVHQQAEVWAAAMWAALPRSSLDQRLEYLYQRALGRAPRDSERASAASFLQQQSAVYGVTDHQDDQRLWSDLCHIILNLKEFSYIH